jgi:hypothetical protein
LCLLALLAEPLAMPAGAQPARVAEAARTPAAAPKGKPREVPLIDRLRSPYEADRPLKEKLRSRASCGSTRADMWA